MRRKFQKNLFFFLMIGSTWIYSNNSDDHISDITSEEPIDSEHYQSNKEVDQFLQDSINNSKKITEALFNSDFVKQSKQQLFYLQGNDFLELKINKVGLGAAGLGMATVLGFNRFTKPGIIRNKLIFKRSLGLGSGYLFYKLVATNDDVKKDICDFFSKIKKD